MKNIITEKIQRRGETPENGENYFEKVERIGGRDNAPIFRASLSFDGKSIEVTGEYGETKKSLLRRTYKNFCSENGWE